MEGLERAFYELKFKVAFLLKKGNAFQDWFAEIMEMRYPDGDFIPIRPWGRAGDQKNDGYLQSARRLFQVYAPNEMEEAPALRKIDQDFKGALQHWEEYFDVWVFVHNSIEGLGPGIAKKLLNLNNVQEGLSVTHWGYNDLRLRFFELRIEDIWAIVGQMPSNQDFLALGFEDLKPVLDAIKRQPAPSGVIGRVPREKIKINRLSEDTERLIGLGRLKSPLVGEFLEKYPDPTYGDEVVETFRQEYERLKYNDLTSDDIFRELQVFAGGELIQDPKHQAAVLAVLAYLFDQCDIFEAEG